MKKIQAWDTFIWMICRVCWATAAVAAAGAIKSVDGMHRYGHWEIGMTEIAFATLTIYTTTTLTLSIAVNVCWSLCSNCNKNGGKNVHSYFFSFFLSLSLSFSVNGHQNQSAMDTCRIFTSWPIFIKIENSIYGGWSHRACAQASKSNPDGYVFI